MKACVLLPPGYSRPIRRSATLPSTSRTASAATWQACAARFAPALYQRMKSGKMPSMIWVFLTKAVRPARTNLPMASTTAPGEPRSQRNSFPISKPTTGWTLGPPATSCKGTRPADGPRSGCQTTYPKIFGGTWSTSPDPSDFHAFSTIDLYAPNANMYRRPDGSAQPIIRMHDKVCGHHGTTRAGWNRS